MASLRDIFKYSGGGEPSQSSPQAALTAPPKGEPSSIRPRSGLLNFTLHSSLSTLFQACSLTGRTIYVKSSLPSAALMMQGEAAVLTHSSSSSFPAALSASFR